MNTALNKIICGDNAEVMAGFSDACIDLVVTSPPYDDLRTYGGHSWEFPSVASELTRVLKPGGVIVWVVADATVDGSETLTSMRQAIHFKDTCGLNVHDTMIYEKVNFANPSTNRYHQMWEYVFILSKGAPKTFNPIRDKKNLYPDGPWGANTFRKPNGKMDSRKIKPAKAMGMRGNVWLGNTAAQEAICQSNEHPAMMPEWLAADHIASWSNPGDVVLDPFNGSGTTCKMAKELNRQYIGIEINEAYCKLAEARMSQEIFQLS